MDRYERIKKIGEGSFGKALLVKRKSDGRHCVVKEIAIGKMAPKEREESKKEVKVLSQLKHPNIVMYQESFEGMGNLYIVMDYCEGGDLYQKITTQRGVNFKEAQVLDYFVQICLALKHIHDRKILHRDLKSQNIFLTRHGIVKLGDFGIARVLKSTVELARTCIGTPYYLSPEICENRPYNNKSDIWSLGCVLYELCTLKHAFEAGNMKNLVLKIIRNRAEGIIMGLNEAVSTWLLNQMKRSKRGNYPPLPNRYTADLRSLVAQCFKRSPIERPSINRILKTPIIQERIKKFLSPEVMEDEFSHTILHKEKFGAHRQPMARPISADVRRQNPVAQVYGVSVAKRPVSAANNKKPNFLPPQQKRPPNAGRRPGAAEVNKAADDRRKEMEGREKRRRNLVENQEREYQEYLKNIQKKRYEKQQADRINRAREAGWKGLLGSDEDKNKKQQGVVNKQQNPMEKYAPKEKVKDNVEERKERPNKEDIPEQRPLSARDRPVPNRERPVSARERPFEAYVAAKEARDNRAMGAEAAERARLVEDYWQRKREAADNKARGNYDYQPSNRQQEPHIGLAARQDDKHPPKANVAVPAVHGRNKEEQAYLQQLEKIRRQNYLERKQLQNRNQFPNKPPLPANNRPEERPGGAAFDPRYDPEARRQKIAALKAQADQRASLLREELNNRRKVLQQRLDNERDERERQRAVQQKQIQNRNERALPVQQNKPREENEKQAKPKIAAAAVGLETAMNQVAAARLFRSCSEGDLQEMTKKGEQMIHDRKHWNQAQDFGLAALPLEVTASAMEITSASDAVFKPHAPEARPESAPHRRIWAAQGKTQVLSALENKTLAVGTIMPTQTPATPDKGSTVILPKGEGGSPKAKQIGETIILPKRSLQNIGEAGTIASPEKPKEGKGGTIVLQKRDCQEKDKLPFVDSKESPKASQEGPDLAKSPQDDGKGTDIEIKSSGTTVIDDNDDSDIEELTAVYEATLNDEEKPRARAAWGAHGKQPLVFKHEDPTDEDIFTKFLENDNSSPSSETSFESPAKEAEKNMNAEGKTDVPLFRKTGKIEREEGKKEEEENLKAQDVSLENDSFHTPNASLLETRTKALQTGLYDSSPKILRTVSMPGLQMKSEDSNEYIANENDDTSESCLSKRHEDEETEESKALQQNQREADAVVIDDLEDDSNNNADNDDNDDEFVADDDDDDDDDDKDDEDDDDDDDDDDDEDDDDDVDRSDEEMEDFEHMLDSMRGVLSSADASPPTSAKVKNNNQNPLDVEDEDENRSSSSELRKSNDEWEDSGDDEEEEDNTEEGDLATGTVKSSIKQATKTAKRTKARETLFQRIEESRKALEDELGTEKFLKIYRYIQAMQENEDDDMNIDPTKDKEVSDLLEGTNEHLYQRILYLVLADAAYFEDNE